MRYINVFALRQFTAEQPTDSLGKLFYNVAQTLAQWRKNVQVRHQLLAMSDELLQDIGLNRFDVEREAGRWFWQPVDVRRRLV